VQGGGTIPDGAQVTVVSPGYSVTIGGRRIELSRPVVEVAEAPIAGAWTSPDRPPVRTRATQGRAGGPIAGKVEGKTALEHADTVINLDADSIDAYLDWHRFTNNELAGIAARLRSLDSGLDNAGTPEFFYGMTKAQIRRHITQRHASLLAKRAL
jgi:hypothetical protein